MASRLFLPLLQRPLSSCLRPRVTSPSSIAGPLSSLSALSTPARPTPTSFQAAALRLQQRQQMAPISTPPAGKFEYLVVVPDKPGMQAKRMEVRASHLEGTKPLVESGMLKTGGALLNEKPESSDPTQWSFYGSTLTIVASSKEEILELMSKDIYARTGVWDLENVQMWPLKSAFREP